MKKCRELPEKARALGDYTEEDIQKVMRKFRWSRSEAMRQLPIVAAAEQRLAKEICRGTWFLPGGRAAPGESILETAVREVMEERGLIAKLNAKIEQGKASDREVARLSGMTVAEFDADTTARDGEAS